jgi:hypothetical protein
MSTGAGCGGGRGGGGGHFFPRGTSLSSPHVRPEPHETERGAVRVVAPAQGSQGNSGDSFEDEDYYLGLLFLINLFSGKQERLFLTKDPVD